MIFKKLFQMKNIRIALVTLLLLAFMLPTAVAQKKGNVDRIPVSSLLEFKTTQSNSPIIKFEKGKAVLLVYFRTDCDDCNQNMMVLGKIAHKYPAQIWMVSPEAISKLQVFEDMYGLYEVDNVHVLQDYLKSMHNWFDFKWLPFAVLFDANGNEVKRFDKLPSSQEVTELLQSK